MSTLETSVHSDTVRLKASIETQSRQTEATIMSAVGDTSTRVEQSQKDVQSSLSKLQDSSQRQEGQLADAAANISSAVSTSEASNVLEHEETCKEFTHQLQQAKAQIASAEAQIAELRKEIKEVNTQLVEAINRAVNYKGRAGSKKQKDLNERANLLHILWTAKDLMLRKLLVSVRVRYLV